MAQKQTMDGPLAAIVEISETDLPEPPEEMMQQAYKVLWQVWKHHPEVWKKVVEMQTLSGGGVEAALAYEERPWDFAVFHIDKKPEGKEFNCKVLRSAFYFTH